MRDWLMILVPVALLFYFIEYPEKGQQFVEWVAGFLR